MVASGMLGRLCVVTMYILQSPFMVTKMGVGISPIAFATKFIIEGVKKEGLELGEQSRVSLRAINWPAHMFEECVLRRIYGLEGKCDATFVWERAIPHALKTTSVWASLSEQNRQFLFLACAISSFGAVISFFAGRTHLLAVLGSMLLGYGIVTCELTPTFQYVVCVLVAFLGLRARSTSRPEPRPTKAETNAATPTKAAVPVKAITKKSN